MCTPAAGNLSARTDGGTLITPTDACLGFLDPAQLAFVDDAGIQQSGARASKTLALHRAIYAAEPTARCVLHTHSTHLVALTLAGVWSEAAVLPPITPYFVMKVGPVPLVKYRRPGDPEVAKDVAALASAARRRGGTDPRRAARAPWPRGLARHALRRRWPCSKNWKKPRACGCCRIRSRRR